MIPKTNALGEKAAKTGEPFLTGAKTESPQLKRKMEDDHDDKNIIKKFGASFRPETHSLEQGWGTGGHMAACGLFIVNVRPYVAL